MPTIGAVLQECSNDLNDQEPGFQYQRWSQSTLLGYFNDALRQIAIRRPDEMVAEVSLPLQFGERQSLPSQYRSIIDILTSQDDSCGTGARMVRGDWEVWAAFNVPNTCTPAGTPYRGRDWFYNPNHPRVFFVWPSVPAGATASVMASVVIAPPEYTTSQYNTTVVDPWLKYLPAVIAWVKHRAYLVDTESMASQAKAAGFMGEFREALGISQAADSRHQSGWNQGQRGEGDPMAARR